MTRSSIAPLTALLALGAVACSSADVDTEPTEPPVDAVTDEPVETSDPSRDGPLLEAPALEDGFQVHLDPFDVQSGEEVYYCYRLPMPVDHDFDLAAMEARFSAGAHHLLVSTVDEAYEPAEGPCTAGEFGFGVPIREAMQANLRFLSGAQTPYADEPRTRLDLDEGMAFQLTGDTTLLLQLHWANTTADVQRATTTINFEYAQTETTMPLESYFFYRSGIELPPQAVTEVASRCTFPEGNRIVSMVSHMHARGVDFTAHRTGAAEQLLYREDSWSEPEMKFWPSDDLVQLGADETIDYSCTFDNDTADWIYEGDGAGEEMCMLIGLYTGGTGTVWGFPGFGFEGNACTALPESG